jgi:23S rRNA G2445 N2-methylase RlmL
MEAVKNDPFFSLQFVSNQTRENCLEAVNKNAHASESVQEKTPEVCFAAISNSGTALKIIDTMARNLFCCH